jgi:hypothetical protein
MRGLIIQNFPHEGSGSAAERRKSEISNSPIPAPTSIRLVNEAGLGCDVELFVGVICFNDYF